MRVRSRVLVAVMTAALAGSLGTAPAALADPATSASTPSSPTTGPPTDVRASWGIGRVELAWSWPSPLPEQEVRGWVVARRVPHGAWVELATTAEEHHVDRTAAPGRTYEYRVHATGTTGDGTPSAPVAVSVPRHDLVGSQHGRLVSLSHVAPVQHHELGVGSSGRPAVSPDGRWTLVSRMVDTETVHLWRIPTYGPGAGAPLTSQGGKALDPAWSPDGRRIAFTLERAGAPPSVWAMTASDGTPALIATDAAEAAWDRDGSLIVTDRPLGTPRLVRVGADGARHAIAGTAGGRHAAVSPDGRFLAFTVPGTSTGPNGAAQADRALALLPLRGSTSTPAVTGLPDGGYHLPAWHPDGRSLVVRYGQRTWSGSRASDHFGLASLRVASTAPPRLERDGAQVVTAISAPAYRALGVHLTTAPAVTGAAPRIGFAMHDPPAGTTFTCRLDGGAATACSSPWRGSGLASGVHQLVVEAHDPSGQRSVTAHRWRVDPTPPSVTLSGPSAVTLTDRATVTYRATDADGIANHDVRYRRARFDGSFGAWERPEKWQGTTATSRTIQVPRGYEYCFSVRARDVLGNLSAWSAQRCTSRPLDDRSLTASAGWSRTTGASYLDGTATTTTRNAAELTRGNVQAKRLWLVATRCPSCGTVEVFIGSTRVGRVDLAASTTRRQQLVALPNNPSVRTGKLTIRTTSSGKRVEIDGVAIRRS